MFASIISTRERQRRPAVSIRAQQVCESLGHLLSGEARAHSQLGLELFYVLLGRA